LNLQRRHFQKINKKKFGFLFENQTVVSPQDTPYSYSTRHKLKNTVLSKILLLKPSKITVWKNSLLNYKTGTSVLDESPCINTQRYYRVLTWVYAHHRNDIPRYIVAVEGW